VRLLPIAIGVRFFSISYRSAVECKGTEGRFGSAILSVPAAPHAALPSAFDRSRQSLNCQVDGTSVTPRAYVLEKTHALVTFAALDSAGASDIAATDMSIPTKNGLIIGTFSH